MHRVLLIRWFYLKMGRLVNRNYFDGKNIKRNVHETENKFNIIIKGEVVPNAVPIRS